MANIPNGTTVHPTLAPPPSTIYAFSTDPSTTPFQVPADQHVSELLTHSSSVVASTPPFSSSSISPSTSMPATISHIAVGALTFHPITSPPQQQQQEHRQPQPQQQLPQKILLIQRASSDSMPNRWEIPGGACDDDDPSILHSVARELFEEAGLVARRIGPVVELVPNWSRLTDRKSRQQRDRGRGRNDGADERGTNAGGGGGGGAVIIASEGEQKQHEQGQKEEEEKGIWVEGYVFPVRSGKLVRKYNFLVEVYGNEDKKDKNENDGHQDPDTVAGMDGVEETMVQKKQEEVRVTLDPVEHQNYVWATEEDVRMKKCGDVCLEFTSSEQLEVILSAFETRRKMLEEQK